MRLARLVLGLPIIRLTLVTRSTLEKNMRILVASGMASLTIVGAMYLAYSV